MSRAMSVTLGARPSCPRAHGQRRAAVARFPFTSQLRAIQCRLIVQFPSTRSCVFVLSAGYGLQLLRTHVGCPSLPVMLTEYLKLNLRSDQPSVRTCTTTTTCTTTEYKECYTIQFSRAKCLFLVSARTWSVITPVSRRADGTLRHDSRK